METKITLEVDFTVDFTGWKEEKMTRDYPGEPAHIEVNSISLFDIEVSEELFTALMKEYGREIEEHCYDKVNGRR